MPVTTFILNKTSSTVIVHFQEGNVLELRKEPSRHVGTEVQRVLWRYINKSHNVYIVRLTKTFQIYLKDLNV